MTVLHQSIRKQVRIYVFFLLNKKKNLQILSLKFGKLRLDQDLSQDFEYFNPELHSQNFLSRFSYSFSSNPYTNYI